MDKPPMPNMKHIRTIRFGPAKSGRDREDTLIPIRVYTNPIDNTSDMRLCGYEQRRFGHRRFGYV